MSRHPHAALVERFYTRLWNGWDDHAVESVLTEDFVFRGSLGTETQGRDGWRGYRDTVRKASPDFHNEVVEIVCQGDRAAARVICSGHHHGTLLGIPGTGRMFRYNIAAFFGFRDSSINEAWVLGDLESLRAQLAIRMTDGGPGSS
jgi:steroid delta-isomerase-like uncharacterized protein